MLTLVNTLWSKRGIVPTFVKVMCQQGEVDINQIGTCRQEKSRLRSSAARKRSGFFKDTKQRTLMAREALRG